jgi:hypothetical protein
MDMIPMPAVPKFNLRRQSKFSHDSRNNLQSQIQVPKCKTYKPGKDEFYFYVNLLDSLLHDTSWSECSAPTKRQDYSFLTRSQSGHPATWLKLSMEEMRTTVSFRQKSE